MASPMMGTRRATRNEMSQLKVVQREEEMALASGGMSSTLSIQGTGPKPKEKAAMNTMRETRGRNPKLSTWLISSTDSEIR